MLFSLKELFLPAVCLKRSAFHSYLFCVQNVKPLSYTAVHDLLDTEDKRQAQQKKALLKLKFFYFC